MLPSAEQLGLCGTERSRMCSQHSMAEVAAGASADAHRRCCARAADVDEMATPSAAIAMSEEGDRDRMPCVRSVLHHADASPGAGLDLVTAR